MSHKYSNNNHSDKLSSTPNKKVFVGNLSTECTENDIRSKFQTFGLIKTINLRNKLGRCCALIYFDRIEDAVSAVTRTRQSPIELHDRQLQVNYALSYKPDHLNESMDFKSKPISTSSQPPPFIERGNFQIIIKGLAPTCNVDILRREIHRLAHIEPLFVDTWLNSKMVYQGILECDNMGELSHFMNRLHNQFIDGHRVMVREGDHRLHRRHIATQSIRKRVRSPSPPREVEYRRNPFVPTEFIGNTGAFTHLQRPLSPTLAQILLQQQHSVLPFQPIPLPAEQHATWSTSVTPLTKRPYLQLTIDTTLKPSSSSSSSSSSSTSTESSQQKDEYSPTSPTMIRDNKSTCDDLSFPITKQNSPLESTLKALTDALLPAIKSSSSNSSSLPDTSHYSRINNSFGSSKSSVTASTTEINSFIPIAL
jgi:RNA recognition motif-containing protein